MCSRVGSAPERGESGSQVGRDLIGDLFGHPGPGAHGRSCPHAVARGQQRLELGAESADLLGELGGARRRLTQPEGDGGRQVAGIVDAHGPGLDLGDAPGVGAEQEDVAGGGLHGEVLVHRSHGDPVGIEDHAIVARLRDGSSAGEGGQPCAASSAEATVDGVVVEMGAAPTASGLDSPRDQFDHVVEAVPGEVRVGCCPSDQLEEGSDIPLAGCRHLGHELLGQHVQR